MPKWEHLTMFDRALYNLRHDKNTVYIRKAMERIAADMVGVNRYSITTRAAERIGEAMATYPEMLAEHSQFAIPPFENMWIEFPARPMLGHERLSGVWLPDADFHVGYLIRNNFVTVFAEGEELNPQPMFIAYQLHQPMSFVDDRLCKQMFGLRPHDYDGLDKFLWGHAMAESLAPDYRSALRRFHTVLVPNSNSVHGAMLADGDLARRTMADAYRGSAGEIRNILAILLMLNQPADLLYINAVPRQRGIVKGKPLPYWGHSTVDLTLDKRRRVTAQRLMRKPVGTHATPRWHTVRGHFCHNREARADTHTHHWIEYEEHRWECALPGCDAKRWWREVPNGRGSANIGFVRQQRRVRTKDDPEVRA
jgi:hypothetical protein